MIQAADKLSLDEKFKLVMHGSAYAMIEASEDRESYAKYLKGETDDFSDTTMRDMQLLDLLVRLGFSLDEMGTYLYRDVVAEAYDRLKRLSFRSDVDKCQSLITDLTKAYSSLYHGLAREDRDMGVTTFHLYIQKAIDHIDDEKVDADLSKSIFGDYLEEESYGLHAFQIASYAAKKFTYDGTGVYHKSLVKKLSDISDQFRLKDSF